MNILITGSSSGIGQQLAKDYLGQGHRVYCCGRDEDSLEKLRRDFPQLATPLVFDIQNLDDCLRASKEVEQLDLLILNAGTCEYIDVNDFDAESFARVMAINVTGTGNCLQALLPKLSEGSVLALMGSSSSFLPLPRAEAYGASKAAIEYLAKTLAVSLKPRGIHVSYIAPGFVETPLTDLNDFPMPMQVDVQFASTKIRAGLEKRRRLIHFPRLFTGALRLLGRLPLGLQIALLGRTLRR
ncbi:MAG: SDR family NAD(P)-dependent oxidoreductase [Pseudomonadales bacterium]|nr:SDR family NAD(P)-dependent oxidoreductase [Pseudomonadales bacterium]